ncbi:SigE family RNA polymerase sigma factor [Actinokineospora diospyrosa]|uniref:RNA polymerase sigma-70 factor, sigma-E family n=1 Tax=Actinokineospora diospyrosa TaxID=103728 RepID=A0ABT1IBZ8_9PSEU|nr:SigE family RNA polymerase sigma factor [Actinokineospora diospyrosa]MCP2270162.1 RNA polymerase sigma-70 factor, sigma-E family [Actinokineospora diospyrosa]
MRADLEEDLAPFIAARWGSLVRSAWLLTGDRDKAEDLVQTVLARLWLRRPVAVDLDAYARRALYTTYITWWRRRWRFEHPTAELPEVAGAADHAEDVSRRLVVDAGMARLSKRQRAVLVLRYFEDRTVEDTAVVLGCSTGAVKTHSSRALAALRADDTLRDLARRGGDR